jgi:hypothetical protein
MGGLAEAAPFTPGNLVVVRVGATGGGTLSNAATAVFLDEFTLNVGQTGPVQSIALPTLASGANAILTMSGTATSEGALSLSADGRFLTLAGYDAAVGTASVANGTTSAAVNRIVAAVDMMGNIDTTTRISDGFNQNNVRSATTVDGTQFYVAGNGASGTGGVRLVGYGSTGASTQITTNLTNARVVGTFEGQLYSTSASGAFQGVSSVGMGLPTTSTEATALPGFPTASGPSPYGFVFRDADTLYVADDRTSTSGGIQKWTRSGGTWTLAYTLNPTGNLGVRGLAGGLIGGQYTLFGTTTQSNANQLVSVIDAGAGSTFNVLATAGANTTFRGVALTSAVAVPEPESVISLLIGGAMVGLLARRRLRRVMTS